MQVNCINCGHPLTADDINIQAALAVCPNCSAVFSLVQDDPYGQFEPDNVALKRKPDEVLPVALPDNFQLDESTDGLNITYRWGTWEGGALVAFGVVWLLFTGGILGSFGRIGGPVGVFSLFTLIFPAVGLGVIGYGIARIVNTTTIRVTPHHIAVNNEPIPTTGNKSFPADAIDQLWIKQIVHRSTNDGRTRYRYTYNVMIRSGERRDTPLVTGLSQPEQALFIEYEIEKYLRIKDQPVAGEMLRGGR